MNPILQGLEAGYGEEEILSYLIKAIPQLGNSIKKATRSGYKTSQILGFLSKNFDTESTKGKSESQIHAINRRSDAERAKYGLQMAATAVAAPLAAGAARSVLSRAMPQSLQNLAAQSVPGLNIPDESLRQPQQSSPLPTGTTPTIPQLPSTSPQQPPINQVATNIPEPTNIEQPKEKSNIVDKLWLGFEKGREKGFDFESDAFLKVAKKMKSTGEIRSKEDFERFFNIFDQKKNEGKELVTALKEASSEYDSQKLTPSEKPEDKLGFKKAFETLKEGSFSNKLYEGVFKSLQEGKDAYAGVKDPLLQAAKPAYDAGQIKSVEDLKNFSDFYQKSINKPEETISKPSEPIKIEKNSIVSAPQGVGEVKEIRNGQALIEVDGKLHKVKEEDLEPPEFSEDEIADAYDNIMAKIPEKHRSGFISWAGYDEDRNVLGFIPRAGKYEELHDITPEEAKMIKEGAGIARTSGEEREGLWVKGEETRGGVISQIIWDRRHKKEAEEKKQLKLGLELPKKEKEDRGMKPLFDEMAHARELSRARDRRKKEEEKARKKKEKDEAKKRKK